VKSSGQVQGEPSFVLEDSTVIPSSVTSMKASAIPDSNEQLAASLTEQILVSHPCNDKTKGDNYKCMYNYKDNGVKIPLIISITKI